jgi:hypothetical protein
MAPVTARIAREKTLATLVRNLFVIEGPNAAEQTRHAEAALLRANPQLAGRDAFRSGAVVVIPADVALPRTDRVVVREAGPNGLLEETADRSEEVRALVQDGLKRDSEDAKAFLGRLDDAKFRSAVTSQSTTGEKLLNEAREVQTKRIEETEARRGALLGAADAAQEALKALLERQRQPR